MLRRLAEEYIIPGYAKGWEFVFNDDEELCIVFNGFMTLKRVARQCRGLWTSAISKQLAYKIV